MTFEYSYNGTAFETTKRAIEKNQQYPHIEAMSYEVHWKCAPSPSLRKCAVKT